jgi:adenine phosphoribosyltransferase
MMEDIKKYIRQVPDFPKPGITFYDITTLFQDPAGLRLTLDRMEQHVRDSRAEKILSIESRGFVIGAALADRLGLPLILARKPGKLPYRTVARDYDLEYGTARLEIHSDAIRPGERVAVVDDLIATGGTLVAACGLVEELGGRVVGISAVIALPYLPFEEKLTGYDLNYLVAFHSE